MPTPLLSRGELLLRLQETFRRYGYEGASLTRIAAATGLGKASLYHYFPNGKEQMAMAVIEDLRQWFDTNIFSPLESVHPPRQRIVSMLETLSRHYESGQAACLPGLFALTEERALFGETIAEFFARWVACLSQTLTDSGLARDIAQRRAHDGVERIQGALILSRAFADNRAFATMAAELPDQLLAGADRSTMWTSRTARFPFAPSAQAIPSRAG
ncbi:TetR/AcrR family transcriptional regulator [Telmatospirillum siberiense]|uniref:TetR family transcriptional regulator n=1 Tax=Telmatospirillum siberiense TaxID=382514 RepID=A0A2N3PZM8_9PROT|nr:TetR/AcrR family transcriptional regulator [Telmatospirillum siberiense]PKU25864.1 TetR family transcriptional regulator [Telmatospirillum siberiense]